MNIFVAGIKLSDSNKEKSVAYNTRKLVKLLVEIMQDAHEACGDDCLVVVALPEYAFTKAAVTIEEKNASLYVLQNAVRQYPKLVLIPGSYAATQRLVDNQKGQAKKNKITRNYATLFVKSEYAKDKHFQDEEAAFKNYLDSGMIGSKLLLQNAAYVLTAEDKIKHHKSFPFYERDKLLGKHKGVLAIGDIEPVHLVRAAGMEFQLGLVVCREHTSFCNIESLSKNPPFIQAIISDSVDLDENNLFGALNIHMDSFLGLGLFLNTAHSAARCIDDLKAKEYVIDKSMTLKHEFDFEFVKKFHRPIGAFVPQRFSKQTSVALPADAAASAEADNDFGFNQCRIT